MTVKTIFLDRDGVINKEVNYLSNIEDFEFINGVFDACKHFQSLGYSIIIITNQSGIGRGYYNEDDFQILTKWMLSKFKENKIEILDIFYCPHSPNNQCQCRKPNTGMFFLARDKYMIDMKSSWSIGDKESDIEASLLSGISNTILVRSGHKTDESKSKAKYFLESIYESIKLISS